MNHALQEKLKSLAEKYETGDFLNGDPSWFMHQVKGVENQEVIAFVASVLSYGSRKQFLPKIQSVLDNSGNDVYDWVKNGSFADFLCENDESCFYRLYTVKQMNRFLKAYQKLILTKGSLREYLEKQKVTNGFSALEHICKFFSGEGVSVIIPKDTRSACKRVCMFLRWMVRDSSPVDLGLWAHFIDRRTLIMPMDTHVVQQANNLGLMSSKNATMTSAKMLTARLSEVFPDDPLRGDFALFGLGVDNQ